MAEQESLFQAIRKALASGIEVAAAEEELFARFGTRCAVVVMDSSGFTRLSKEYGILPFLACFVRVRDLIEEVFGRFRCREFHSEGDNIYAEFETAGDALEAALAALGAVGDARLPAADGSPFRTSIGIGYGTLLRSEDEGLFGDEMNLASKLGEDIANPGEVLLTESAYASISGKQKKLFSLRQTAVSGLQITHYVMQAGS